MLNRDTGQELEAGMGSSHVWDCLGSASWERECRTGATSEIMLGGTTPIQICTVVVLSYTQSEHRPLPALPDLAVDPNPVDAYYIEVLGVDRLNGLSLVYFSLVALEGPSRLSLSSLSCS